jgi:hypothetical protein
MAFTFAQSAEKVGFIAIRTKPAQQALGPVRPLIANLEALNGMRNRAFFRPISLAAVVKRGTDVPGCRKKNETH